ncbi:MAG: DUF4160 domain-containing protein [Planctomycetota bacterium]|nr:DUF4160 domain-containing protein [Planctomycetota bacterium]
MPTLSRFYGIVIRMRFNDHAPPHFHAVYGEYELRVGIWPVKILSGEAPPRVRSMVLEWAALHQEELRTAWGQCRVGEEPTQIASLE